MQNSSKYYKLFKYARDVDGNAFIPTGKNFGGIYSKRSWNRLREILPREAAFAAIPDDDPPEAMDQALRAIRGGR